MLHYSHGTRDSLDKCELVEAKVIYPGSSRKSFKRKWASPDASGTYRASGVCRDRSQEGAIKNQRKPIPDAPKGMRLNKESKSSIDISDHLRSREHQDLRLII